ncbi:hypothetical protein PG994_005748 [Apiospora phragmitis]|uniref:3beta-hydroxysteroid 3-dehydrogenase n=1 Tax=Apiospora phragmitis TaxID=2905665 RepID=A0ABR1VD76_9PEZI
MATTPQGSIFVTGANGGLGSAIVDQIARTPDSGCELSRYDLVPLDLGSLASVRAAGALPRLRALVLNAGWQEYTTQTRTADGFDQAFQVNYLSHFLLTLLLLESLDRERGRVVVLGSWSHETTDRRNTMGPTHGRRVHGRAVPADFCGPAHGHREGRHGEVELDGGTSGRELSERIAADPALSALTVVGVDPGAMPSNLIRDRGTPLLRFMADWLMPWLVPIMSWFQPNGNFRTTAQSARDVLRAAGLFSGNDASANGTYFNGSVVGDVGPEAKDDVKCKTLWTDGVRFAEVQDGDTVLADWR